MTICQYHLVICDFFLFVPPQNFLAVLVTDPALLHLFAMDQVFTIRHFAAYNIDPFANAVQNFRVLKDLHQEARAIVAVHSQEKPEPSESTVWGYRYVTEDEYNRILNTKMIKSAYVLFEEYMQCPQEQKFNHPWKDVYYSFLESASKAMGRKESDAELTDADVYAYLIWVGARWFSEFEYSCGPRGIYFRWTPLVPSHVKQIVHKVEFKFPEMVDRHSHLIKINLTSVVKHLQGKVFRVCPTTKKWLPTIPQDFLDHVDKCPIPVFAEEADFDESLVTPIIGCIVTPTGAIPLEHLVCILSQETSEERGFAFWKLKHFPLSPQVSRSPSPTEEPVNEIIDFVSNSNK